MSRNSKSRSIETSTNIGMTLLESTHNTKVFSIGLVCAGWIVMTIQSVFKFFFPTTSVILYMFVFGTKRY